MFENETAVAVVIKNIMEDLTMIGLLTSRLVWNVSATAMVLLLMVCSICSQYCVALRPKLVSDSDGMITVMDLMIIVNHHSPCYRSDALFGFFQFFFNLFVYACVGLSGLVSSHHSNGMTKTLVALWYSLTLVIG